MANGKEIETWALNSSLKHRRSKWKWPYQPKPSQYSWNIWKHALNQVLYTHQQLKYKLGEWQRHSHQLWPVMLSPFRITHQFVLIKPPDSFQSYLHVLPTPLKDLHGALTNITEPIARQLLQDLYAGNMIGTSIGNHHPQGCSTYTYILSSQEEDYHVVGNGIVPGPSQRISPNRPYLYGHLALYSFLFHLRQYYLTKELIVPSHPKRSLLTDYNFPSKFITDLCIITPIQQLHKTMTNMISPKLQATISNVTFPDQDVLTELHTVLHHIPFHPTVSLFGSHYIKPQGHPVKAVVPVSQSLIHQANHINIHYHQECQRIQRPSLESSHLPHSGVTVQYQNQTISSGLEDIVRYHNTAKELLNYIQHKTRLSQTLVLHIDWIAFQKAFEQNTFLYRITISKLTHS